MISSSISPAGLDKLWSRILYGDKTRNAVLMGGEIHNCVFAYGMTLQQVEKEFRERNYYTYLIARKRDPLDDRDLMIDFPGGAQKTYHLYVSTWGYELSLFEESQTYQENFDKLNDTGFLCLSYKEAHSDSMEIEILSKIKTGLTGRTGRTGLIGRTGHKKI